MSSATVVYLLSRNAIGSAWVRRECDWERRLLGVRDPVELPLLVGLESSVLPEGYPTHRVFEASELPGGGAGLVLDAVVEEIRHPRGTHLR